MVCSMVSRRGLMKAATIAAIRAWSDCAAKSSACSAWTRTGEGEIYA